MVNVPYSSSGLVVCPGHAQAQSSANQSSANQSSAIRSGVILLEAIVALFVMTVAVALVGHLVVASQHHARQQVNRLVAVQEATNLMEQLIVTPWEALTSVDANRKTISLEAAQQLPTASLKVVVEEEPSAWPTRRITVEVQWRGRSGGVPQRVRLVSWVPKPVGDAS